jgi:hypothetical protein
VLNLVFEHGQHLLQLFPATGVMVGPGSAPGGGHRLGQELMFFGESHSCSPPIRKIKLVTAGPASQALSTATPKMAGSTTQTKKNSITGRRSPGWERGIGFGRGESQPGSQR